MKYKFFLTIILLTSFSSCDSLNSSSLTNNSSTSSWSNTYSDTHLESSPIPEGPFFNFDNQDDRGRILAQYIIERNFDYEEVEDYNGTHLNPDNYKEDKEKEVWYREDDVEVGDYQDEIIEYHPYNPALKDLIDNYANGILNNREIEAIYALIDSNDDVINKVNQTYDELRLHHDVYFNEYYIFNNYYRHEDTTLIRYPNLIKVGEIIGSVLYQDNFYESFTAESQTIATPSTIIAMVDETFPPGSTNAVDYKTLTIRTPGNFKKALNLGAGINAKTWLDKHFEEYDKFQLTNNNYAYFVEGVKTSEQTSLSYHFRVKQHIDNTNTLQWEMDIDYTLYIEEGIVRKVEIAQKYWDINH